MKKASILFGLVLIASMSLFAERVPVETARKVATTFLSNNGAKATALTDLSKAAGFPNLYIFNAEEGFVVMSADDCVKPILGYSLTGSFEAEGMPENLVWWLQGYNDQIQYAIDNQMKASPETAQLWKDLAEGKPNTAKATVVVEPLIQTQWGQNAPYNNLCPSNNNQRAITGCVATAMAQIMKYWNYPTRGIGSHSYRYSVYGNISADFGATLYDWDNMTNTYSSTSTLDQKTAVATLMYHCGVVVEMMYGPSESGSNTKRSSIAMNTYFNYNTSYLKKDDFASQKWIDTLKYELNNGRPILYSGTGDKGGHAFVCDGYRSDDFFHFNWGWSGSSDNYFSVGNLNPGSFNFTSDQAAVINLYPLTDETTPIALENSQATLTWTDSQGCDSYNIYRNDALIATTTETTYTDPTPAYGSNKYYVRGLSDTILTQPSNYAVLTIDYPTPLASHLQADHSGNDLSLTWESSDWCFPASADATSFSYVDEERQVNKDSHYIWDEGNFVLSWGHRYPAEILASYNGKAIHEVSFFSMYPGAFDIIIYQDTEDDRPVSEIARESITTARIGWSRVRFSEPAIVDSSQDLWVFVSNTDCKVHTVYHKTISGNDNGAYFAGSNPSFFCNKLTDNTIWLIHTYLTDGTYTYNLYDGTTKVNGDVPISGTSYTMNNLSNNTSHKFTVKTKYYGGESAASNMVGVTLGSAEVTTLNLDDDDIMTLTEGSALTVTGTITNTDPANLVIEDGAQLIHPSCTVQATMKKTIQPYTEGISDGWYTIASPVDEYSVNSVTTDAYDLYTYDEKNVYWRNQKQAANNITQFTEGKGFLYANAALQSLNFVGNMKATDGQVIVPMSYQSNNENLKGFNLVGNPFTRNLNYGDITLGGEPITTYYSADGGTELVSHSITANPIKPGQGFLVQATAEEQNLVFNPTSSKGEELKPSYICIEAGDGSFTDRAIVQLNEGNILHKTSLNNNTAKLSVRHHNADFATVTIDTSENELPLHFSAAHDGIYTLNVSIANLNPNYLHLIDHLTGADIDLLKTPSYTFEAKSDDYVFRFKLVFSAQNNNEDNDCFAVISNGQIIITGIEGNPSLQLVDMTGRTVLRKDGTCTVSTDGMAPGVYVLRIIHGNNIKTEKIIIK